VRNPKRVAALKKRLEAWQPLGLRMYWLNGDEARQQEPLLAPDICAAVYAPEEAQIIATQVVKAYAQAAQHLGADFYEHAEVTGLQFSANHSSVTGVSLRGREPIACKHLVIAAGAWSAQCGIWLGLSIPVQPLRGQMLALTQPPGQSLRHIIFGEGAYLVPRDNYIIVGATKEEAGFALEVTDEGTAWLRHSAVKLLPVLAQSSIIEQWAGLRPRTPDTRPILGPAPGWENVTIATGHNSVGIMLSALTGQAMADVITTGRIPELIRPFSPSA
jgi:glycine oxidase